MRDSAEKILRKAVAFYGGDSRGPLQAIDVARYLAEQKPITLNPRLVFEWATHHKYDDVEAARKRNEALGESASVDLLNGYRWLHQMMEWVADHMEINNSVCFRCTHYEVAGMWQDFPLCERCLKDMAKADAQKKVTELPAHIKDVRDRIAAVFGQIKTTPRNHAEVCKQPKIRHSYYVKTPAGFVMHDLSLTQDQGSSQMWTRDELDSFVRPPFEDAETPLEITRVIK